MMRVLSMLLVAGANVRAAQFSISFPLSAIARMAAKAANLNLIDDRLTGRVRLYLTRDNTTAPYESSSDDQSTGQVFGVDADAWAAGEVLVVDDSTLGSPVASLASLADGASTYYVQAELFLYDLYERQGIAGPTWLPKTCVSAGGANGQYAKPDGTLFSAVVEVTALSPASSVHLSLDRVTPKAVSPGCAGLGDGVDSDWVKTVRVTSPLLSEFWKREIQLEACVLVPLGWDDNSTEHAGARYPLVVAHGHYSPLFFSGGGFRETDPNCDPDAEGYDCVQEQYAYYLYKNWTSTNASESSLVGARMLVMTINHPVPLFDDSYAVNSASLGPYGDAIVTELIPEVEARYRGLGQGWARGLYGGSTGGWETVASQVFYPDAFNGAFAACPDPIAFTSYATLDIYSSTNAYYYDAPFKRDSYSGVTWPGYGHPYGQTSATIQEMNQRELVLGTHSRSCGQWDIWEAVFGPVCSGGFPCRLYDKLTGEINATTAAYWRENFDLVHILERDWPSLGPKLQGKLHLFVGNSDTYFLTNAVMDAEDVLSTLVDPISDAEVVIGTHGGRGYEHCFRGYEYASTTTASPAADSSSSSSGTRRKEEGGEGVEEELAEPLPNSLTRLTYNQAFLPRMAEHFAATAPAGADVTSWRY